MASALHLQNEKDFDEFIKDNGLTSVLFSASWATQCEQLSAILFELEGQMKNFRAAVIDAEGIPEVSFAQKVTAVPTIIYFKGGKEVDRLNGFNPSEMRTKLLKHSFGNLPSDSVKNSVAAENGENLNEKLKRLINSSRLMLFMKGSPEQPKCGFSRQMIDVLKELNADFSTFDILTDEEVRQGLKEYSNWPTYPQLYLNGELIGGLDVLREEIKDPDFVAKLPKKIALNDRLKSLIETSRLTLFMKGNSEQPKCGFSRQMVELLKEANADYWSFDILTDEEVRQGLKEYSNWPTYPQLYLDGELVGGLDVVREEMKDPSFIARLPKKEDRKC